jgi:hypothetical protein
MIVTIPMKALRDNVASGEWQLEMLDDGVETRKVTMKDETIWYCWFDLCDITVCLMEEFISSVETAMTGGKKNYY